MSDPPNFQRGERVIIKHRGEFVRGEILLASPNGRSIALGYDGIIAGCLRVLPLFWDDATGGYISLIGGKPVDVQRMPQ